MKVYIIGGKAGSGKNTSANYMKEYYESIGKKALVTEISKYLKSYAYEIVNWDGNYETKPRAFLQEIGSLIRHDLFNEDFFINRLLEDIKVYEKYVDVVIIADARFPREITALKESYNAVSIEIINKFSDYALKGSEEKHETETALDLFNGFDYIVENKTFEMLKKYMIKIVNEVEENEK